MIGKVIEGRFAGAAVHRLAEKNVLYIEREDGAKIALSKKNVISIENVTDQYPAGGDKVLMVMWQDFETSILQIGISAAPAKAPAQEQEVQEEQEQQEQPVAPEKKKLSGLAVGLICLIVVQVIAILGLGAYILGLF